MKASEWMTEKSDKLLHFLVAAIILSIGCRFGYLGMSISWALVVAFSIIKEFLLDDEKDAEDIHWAILGSLVIGIMYLITWNV